MSKARIYQPDKNPMQSGKGKADIWLLEFTPETPYFTDGLMGWSGMSDSVREISMRFPTKEAAIAYATKQNLKFEAANPNRRVERRKAYADNFLFNKITG